MYSNATCTSSKPPFSTSLPIIWFGFVIRHPPPLIGSSPSMPRLSNVRTSFQRYLHRIRRAYRVIDGLDSNGLHDHSSPLSLGLVSSQLISLVLLVFRSSDVLFQSSVLSNGNRGQ
ncbi:hypothetical protein PGTUg99_025660 [Puccinia graminis f. sp. tritici]|uniref:Uncharacterized protein n=1 Tax=Puccinia graminis f. sp. tritici TaxID=56615 RepID=A0A5B0NJ33_PUCGR|nr:hypothetical protein PGTUg99_025660 [Puccinia graminis f. sp. tritici]